jgi:uncharacterized phiE125 gp8 family phage protein
MPVGTIHYALSRATSTPGPDVEPLTLAETKDHLRETATGQNTLISELIQAAREDGEERTWRAWITQKWDLALDHFPAGDGPIQVPKPPLQSVQHVRYVNATGGTSTLPATGYTVDAHSEPGRITPAFGTHWPTTRDVPSAVTVQFTAGYGATGSDVPRRLRQAALLSVADWYENRGDTESVEPPAAALAIYHNARPYRFG